MGNQNHNVALSRALFELRSGRGIAVDGFAFQPIEGEAVPLGGTLVAPKAVDESFLPAPAREPQNAAEETAIELLKRAGLLPVAAVLESAEMEFTSTLLMQAMQQDRVEVTEMSRAKLPIKATEDAQIISFRSPSSAVEHVAVVVGDPKSQKAPLVRVHSSCLTGDLLGSLRCDCGDQLAMALKQIAETGHGVICYLQQEGRGIGISNKVRAYALQDEGLDTLDANLALGFAADERDFGLAVAMLHALEIETITLLSNNPDKLQQLQERGIRVASQQSLSAVANTHNAQYLKTKQQRFGHQLDS